jgi:hypothetical protein
MFEAARREARKRLKAIATIGVASALVVGGVAAAQGGSGGESQDPTQHPPGSPPMLGIGMKGLTYAELHVRDKEGDGDVIRIDQGKVKSVDESSITLTENDGNEVTIAVDEDTDVVGKPGEDTTLDDLQTGQLVSVSAPDGEAAKAVMVLPRKGDVVSAFAPGSMPPPPGGAEFSIQRSAG